MSFHFEKDWTGRSGEGDETGLETCRVPSSVPGLGIAAQALPSWPMGEGEGQQLFSPI